MYATLTTSSYTSWAFEHKLKLNRYLKFPSAVCVCTKMHQFEFATAVNESSVNFKREDFYTS